jgi:flagellar protein FlaG
MSIDIDKIAPAVVPEQAAANRAVAKAAEPVVATAQQVQSSEPEVPVTNEAVKAAAAEIESYLKSVGRSLEFKLDDDSGRMVVSVRDSETGELIRQIPGEDALRLARSKDAGSLFVRMKV